jgi:hypothetical protein
MPPRSAGLPALTQAEIDWLIGWRAGSYQKETTSTTPTDSTGYFAETILPIFRDSCAGGGCHSETMPSNGYPQNGLLLSYDDIRKNFTTILDRIESTDSSYKMPPKDSDRVFYASDIDTLEQWRDDGFPRNDAPTTTEPTTGGSSNISFVGNLKDTLVENCAKSGCHSESGLGDNDYEVSYYGTKEMVDEVIRRLRSKTESQMMPPPERREGLTSSEKRELTETLPEQLEAWKREGFRK